MKQVVIENPILNSPFHEPTRHFRFNDEGITDEIVSARRVSDYFVPIAKPKMKGKAAKQQNFFDEGIEYSRKDGHGPADPLNLIVEVTGEKKKDKVAKVATARNLWVPAVNNHGGFGRWAFVEIDDPWNSAAKLREVSADDADGRR